MVLNSGAAVRVAQVSANLCQYISCNPERFSSDTVLRLLFCLPFRRLALSLSTCLGFTAYAPSAADDAPFHSD
ncbi:hypothetical protein K1719_007475 [Acacia pycnantha]|nr:hypothetical protein K1719_007475 [Acacia pycnantha]